MKKKILIILSFVLLILFTSIISIVIARWQIALKLETIDINSSKYSVTLKKGNEVIATYNNLELDSYVYLPMLDDLLFQGWQKGSGSIYSGTNGEIAFEIKVSLIKGSDSSHDFILNAVIGSVPNDKVLFKVHYGTNTLETLVNISDTRFYMFNINVPDTLNNKLFLNFKTHNNLTISHYNYFNELKNTIDIDLNDYFQLSTLGGETIELDAVYEE